VGEKEPENGFIPDFSQLGDTFVGDCGALNGPFEYRIIEWLMLPRTIEYRKYQNAPLTRISQDFSGLVEKIQAIGQFEFDLNDEGLKIYGYKP